MPVTVDTFDEHTQLYRTYKLYRKDELKKEWSLFRLIHLEHMSETYSYVTCTVNDEDEALVLTALLIRKTGENPANFCYDAENNKLLANCVSPAYKENVLRDSYLDVISMFVGAEGLKYMKKDPVGKDLFDEEEPYKSGRIETMPWAGKFHSHMGLINQ